jgi:chromosome segregation ATPase
LQAFVLANATCAATRWARDAELAGARQKEASLRGAMDEKKAELVALSAQLAAAQSRAHEAARAAVEARLESERASVEVRLPGCLSRHSHSQGVSDCLRGLYLFYCKI